MPPGVQRRLLLMVPRADRRYVRACLRHSTNKDRAPLSTTMQAPRATKTTGKNG